MNYELSSFDDGSDSLWIISKNLKNFSSPYYKEYDQTFKTHHKIMKEFYKDLNMSKLQEEKNNILIVSYFCEKTIHNLAKDQKNLLFISGFWNSNEEIEKYLQKKNTDQKYCVFLSFEDQLEKNYITISFKSFYQWILKDKLEELKREYDSLGKAIENFDFDKLKKLTDKFSQSVDEMLELEKNAHIKDSERLFIYYITNIQTFTKEYPKIYFLITSLYDTCPFCLAFYKNCQTVLKQNPIFIINSFNQYHENKIHIDSLRFYEKNINEITQEIVKKEIIFKIQSPEYYFSQPKTYLEPNIKFSKFKHYMEETLLSFKKDIEKEIKK